MCSQLAQVIPDVSLFIFDKPDGIKEKAAAGLTQHCVGMADKLVIDGTTAADWIWETVNGNGKCVGLSLLERFPD